MSQHQVETTEKFGLEGALGVVDTQRSVTGVHAYHEGERANDHLASIYDTHNDQFEVVVPFIQRGLDRGERCLYVADDNTREEVLDALRKGGIDVASARDSGALSIHTKADTYLQTGAFEQDAMLDFWQERLAQARDKDDYAGVRAAAEMTWALDEGTALDRLVEYEAMLNTIYPGEDYVVLCQYNRERFPADVLSDVIRNHPLVIYDGTVCQNVYYYPPEEFVGTDHPLLDVDRVVEELVSRARAQSTLQESKHHRQPWLHQQEVVAKLGQRVVEAHDPDRLVTDVTEQVADTLNTDYCAILEELPTGEELLVREGIGWQDGIVGEAAVSTDHDVPTGYALQSAEPVIIEDLATDSRFSGTGLLTTHDVTSGISVCIGSQDDPWGVLGVYTREQQDFSDHDVAFVQSVANIVAMAVDSTERKQTQHALETNISSPDRSSDETLTTITDGREVNDSLNAVLRAAYDNDIDLEHFYACRNDPPYPDWDLSIVEARKPPETPDG